MLIFQLPACLSVCGVKETEGEEVGVWLQVFLSPACSLCVSVCAPFAHEHAEVA